jgi:hypothetical protein
VKGIFYLECTGYKFGNMDNSYFLRIFRFFLLFLTFQCGSLFGQNDTIRQQIGIGFWPILSNYKFEYIPFSNFEYRRYLGKRSYYNLCLEGYYESRNDGDYRRYLVTPVISYGISSLNSRLFKLSLAARVSIPYKEYFNSYVFPVSGEKSERIEKDYGLFLGPELGLEIRLFRFNSTALSIFSKIYVGYGFVKQNDYYSSSGSPGYKNNYTEQTFYGSGSIGLFYRFMKIK